MQALQAGRRRAGDRRQQHRQVVCKISTQTQTRYAFLTLCSSFDHSSFVFVFRTIFLAEEAQSAIDLANVLNEYASTQLSVVFCLFAVLTGVVLLCSVPDLDTIQHSAALFFAVCNVDIIGHQIVPVWFSTRSAVLAV